MWFVFKMCFIRLKVNMPWRSIAPHFPKLYTSLLFRLLILRSTLLLLKQGYRLGRMLLPQQQ